MVDTALFRGITYNKEKIVCLDDVMAPPYDIISEKMQQELYDKHPKNFVQLILGKQYPTDTEENNRYTRAKKLFSEWQQQKILIESPTSTIYPYKIEYTNQKKKMIMNGFFIILKLDPDYKQVRAHERTLSKPKADRLQLMRACDANLEPIELLYMDKTDSIKKTIDKNLKEPLIQVKGYDGFTHTLWKLEDTQIISQIVNKLKDEVLFIADGHHRYQTSINYAAEKREKTGDTRDDAPFNYIMVVLANMFDTGLSILPTHRLVTMPDLDLEHLIGSFKKYFDVKEKTITDKTLDDDYIGAELTQEIHTKTKHKFAMYTREKYYVLTLKDETIMDSLAGDHSKTWRTLDVSILHKIILEKIMGITENNIEDHVKYTRVDAEAIQFVNEGKYTLSFLMNATKIEELKAVAEAGEHMPQKSTYFLPKMLSGLVMYKF